MPARRDLDQARAEVVDVATRLLARRGLDGLTIRQVAGEAGVSTSFVTHYFVGKRDLVTEIFRTNAAAARARVDRALEDDTDPLRAVLVALLPVDRVRVREWRVWLAFQSLAVGDRDLAREWRQRVESYTQRLVELIAAEQSAGTIPPTLDPRLTAVLLQSVVDGIAVRVILNPAALPPEHQRRLVDDQLHTIRTRS